MPAVWAAAIGAGAGLLGGAMTNRQSAQNTASANAETERSTQMQIDFQREMSNTAWQRGTADMKAAGLNPMLGYTMGGASSPSGSSYQAQVPQVQNLGTAATTSAAQAVQTAVGVQEAKLTAAKQDLTKAQTTQALSSAGNLDSQAAVNRKELDRLDQLISGAYWDAKTAAFKSNMAQYDAWTKQWVWDHGGPEAASQLVRSQAQEAANRAQIVGNEIPESVAQAAFWTKVGTAPLYTNFGLTSAGKAINALGPMTKTGARFPNALR